MGLFNVRRTAGERRDWSGLHWPRMLWRSRVLLRIFVHRARTRRHVLLLIIILALVGLGGYELYSSGQLASLTSWFQSQTGIGTLNAVQIAQYAMNAGWTQPDLTTAVAIALAESGGNPSAIGDQNLAPSNGPSYGLWQINVGANPEFAGDNLTDPQTNANDAYQLYEASGFSPWTTYKTGAYLAYVTQAQVGVQNA
jgi:Lysozyme like domain